jgi:hypothetical protein
MNTEEPKPMPMPIPRRKIPAKGKVRYSISPRGFVFFLLAIIVIFIGLFGYLEYDRLIKPYMREYLCCVPAVILAGLLFFLGFASRTTVVRKVNIPQPGTQNQNISLDNQGSVDHLRQGPVIGDKDAGPIKNRRIPTPSMPDDGLKPYKPIAPTKDELVAQKKNILQFLKSLDEQHKDGLIMDGAYFGLKNKYRRELANLKIKINDSANGKNKQNKGV